MDTTKVSIDLNSVTCHLQIQALLGRGKWSHAYLQTKAGFWHTVQTDHQITKNAMQAISCSTVIAAIILGNFCAENFLCFIFVTFNSCH